MVPAVGRALALGPRDRLLEERHGLVRAVERTQRLPDGVAGKRDRLRVPGILLAGGERTLERGQRFRVLAGLVVLPAEVVQQRPEPVPRVVARLRERDAALRPRHVLVPAWGGERRHVRRVARQEAVARLERERVRRLEERERTLGVPARAVQPAPLEVDPHPRPELTGGLGLRLLDEPLPRLEVATESLDARELRQDLCPAGCGGLLVERLTEAALRRVEVGEVPERA